MEITYETIIKYLGNKTPKKEPDAKASFITQKNIFTYANAFPEKFASLLTEKFYRLGITVYDDKKNNISFWSSLLTLIDKEFIMQPDKDMLTSINIFKEQLLEKYSKQYSSFLKQFDKVDIRERFKLNVDINVLQYIVDVLDINIIILDFMEQNSEQCIYSVYKKDILNPWKQTFIFAKYDEFWEPIMLVRGKGEIQRTFDYNNNNIKKILLSDDIVKYYMGDTINKEYIYMNNISDVISMEEKNLDIKKIIIKKDITNDESDSDSSVKTDIDTNDIFVDNDEMIEMKKLNKTKLTKMKMDEVKKIANKLKLDVDNITKPNIVTMILNKVSLLV
jgi:hypothetical protein